MPLVDQELGTVQALGEDAIAAGRRLYVEGAVVPRSGGSAGIERRGESHTSTETKLSCLRFKNRSIKKLWEPHISPYLADELMPGEGLEGYRICPTVLTLENVYMVFTWLYTHLGYRGVPNV